DDSYFTFTHLATFNDKICFAGQPLGVINPNIITFDGNDLNTVTIPGTLLGGNSSYFSEIQNKLFLRIGLTPSGSELWSYDGDSFSLIPNATSYILGGFELEFNSQLILRYFDPNITGSEIYHLQKYDGSNLSPIPSPNNTFFYDIIEAKGNVL